MSTKGEEDGDKIQEYREVSPSLPAGPQSVHGEEGEEEQVNKCLSSCR